MNQPLEADAHQLVAALRRIQELATDLPEGTLAEAQKALAAIWDDCDLTLAAAVKPD
jgi:hypothetical protein